MMSSFKQAQTHHFLLCTKNIHSHVIPTIPPISQSLAYSTGYVSSTVFTTHQLTLVGRICLLWCWVRAMISLADFLPFFPPFFTYSVGGCVYNYTNLCYCVRFFIWMISVANEAIACSLLSPSHSRMCCTFSLLAYSLIFPQFSSTSHSSKWSRVNILLCLWQR